MRLDRVVDGDPVKLFVLPKTDRPDAVDRRFERFIMSDDVFGLDVETTAIDEDMGMFDPAMRLRMVQFGNRDEAWALDPHNEFWRPRIEAFLRLPDVRFVSHTNYDPLWVRREFDINLDQRSIDTKPMADLVLPGTRHRKDLKALSDRYIDGGLSEAERVLHEHFAALAPRIPTPDKNGKVINRKPTGKKLRAWGFTHVGLDDELFGQYAGLDAIYVRRLLDILARIIKAKGMGKLSKREQRIARQATAIQVRGHRVDIEYTRELLKEIGAAYGEADARLRDVFGFTPLSPRVPKWLEDHGATFTEFTKTGQPELSKDTLPNLVDRYRNDEFLGPIFADKLALSKNKNLRTNLGKLLNAVDADGFVHPKINTMAAHTGRMSIVNPPMQTFKKEDKRLRGCFITRDGKVFVGADYNSQETRIAAALSRDETLLEIIATGESQHVLTFKKMYGYWDGDKSTDLYRGVKVLDFSQQYGAGPRNIGDQLGLPRGPGGEANPEAVEMWNKWRAVYAGLVIWTDRMSNVSTVVNPWGRHVPSDPFRRYANGNYMVQSSGRDMLGDALIELEDRGWGDTIWLPIHDEIVLEVDEGAAEEALTVLAESMFCQFGDIEVPAEPEIIGTRWGSGG